MRWILILCRQLGGVQVILLRMSKQLLMGDMLLLDIHIVLDSTESFGAGSNDMFVLKFSSSGSLRWAKTIGSTNSDSANSVIELSDGSIAVTGQIYQSGYSYDLVLLFMDSSGNIQRAHSFGGTSPDYAHSASKAFDDGLIITGYTSSYGNGSSDAITKSLLTNKAEGRI